MPSLIYLVGCGKQKRSEPALAESLYTGALFQKSLTLAEIQAKRSGGAVFILSAKYGLIAPTARIAPYDLALSDLSASQRNEWGIDVAHALADYYRKSGRIGNSELVFYAGRLYVQAVESGVARMLGTSPRSRQPMYGLQIGERLAWLNDQLSSL